MAAQPAKHSGVLVHWCSWYVWFIALTGLQFLHLMKGSFRRTLSTVEPDNLAFCGGYDPL